MQDLANVAWAVATTDQSNERLMAALAEAARRCVSNFNAQDISSTVWAFATVGDAGVAISSTVPEVERQDAELHVQSVARAGHTSGTFAAGMARDVPRTHRSGCQSTTLLFTTLASAAE
eukprot:gnl/TRDRNA2_/TRDRNA2_123440_c0_seq1.p1 gnl/TRDRNA2_/TRDRNA2_123440_c0~~gnl/TRDRNA2_/TRDRNA2_123440_c0_seq1.p1  ORF type:complete len:119 (+),score=9.80 gnl/TRDRNA2_/TRDRNA2_123440_c0_seq1:186-542(+)